MLEYILERQKKFQERFFDVGSLTHDEKIKWTKEFILCMHQELAEVMNTLSWKSYHTYLRAYSVNDTQEEIIDCFKFLLNLMIIWEMDPEKILKQFKEKSDIVEERIKLK